MHMRKKNILKKYNYKEKYEYKVETKFIELQIALLIISKICHLNKIL